MKNEVTVTLDKGRNAYYNNYIDQFEVVLTREQVQDALKKLNEPEFKKGDWIRVDDYSAPFVITHDYGKAGLMVTNVASGVHIWIELTNVIRKLPNPYQGLEEPK